MAADVALNPADTLAWEARNRTWSGIGVLLAGVLTILGAVVTASALRNTPSVTVFDALRDAAGRPPRSGGLATDTVLYYHRHAGALTLGQVLTGLGGLLAGAGLVYLFVATRARREGMGQWGLAVLAAGAVAFLVGSIVPQIAVDVSAASFASSADHSTLAAHDALQPGAALAGAVIGFIGTIALAVGFLVVSVNAMRVGLLTRFMGILGIISGVLSVLMQGALPIVQAFWLIALGVLYLRRWPNGMPPAWDSGKAEPWPTRQEQLAARNRVAAEPDEAPAAPAQPRAKKKSRRR